MRVAIGDWLDSGVEMVEEKNLLASKRSSLLPFYSSPRRTILFRIKHQNFVGTLQFFEIDGQTPLLLGAAVGEAIWHGRD